MDISAALGTDSSHHDLLGFGSPDKETRENPFNMSRQSSSQDTLRVNGSPSPAKPTNNGLSSAPTASRPSHFRSATHGAPIRASHDLPRPAWHSPQGRRRFSLTLRRHHADDDDDGDDRNFRDDGEFRSVNIINLLGMDMLDELRMRRLQEGFLLLLERY